MLSVSGEASIDGGLQATLHEVVETLAPLDRTPCSPGERQSAAPVIAAAQNGKVTCRDEVAAPETRAPV